MLIDRGGILLVLAAAVSVILKYISDHILPSAAKSLIVELTGLYFLLPVSELLQYLLC